MNRRTRWLAIGALGTLAMVMAVQAPADAPVLITKSVTLKDEDALAALQVSNPRHYAIARRIIDAAMEICNAPDPSVLPAEFNAQGISCSKSSWTASDPPRRQLLFAIEDTFYFAWVTLSDTGAKLVPANADPATGSAP